MFHELLAEYLARTLTFISFDREQVHGRMKTTRLGRAEVFIRDEKSYCIHPCYDMCSMTLYYD